MKNMSEIKSDQVEEVRETDSLTEVRETDSLTEVRETDSLTEVRETDSLTEVPSESTREVTMLEYVNEHFKYIKEAIDDQRNIIGMLDKMVFKEMCKLEAVIRIMIDKLNIKQEDVVSEFNNVIKEYQKDVDDMREKEEKAKKSQSKDVKDLSEEEAEEIRNKIKAEVTD